MICQPCRDAADRHAAADQHCGATGGPGARCDCAHRTDRYRPAPPPGLVAVAAFYDQLARATDAHRRAQDEALAVDTWRQLINGPRADTTKD